MCLACGSQWPPWSRQIHVAPPPVKEETIYVDDNTQFYPDYRQGIHPPGPVYQSLGPTPANYYGAGMYPMAGPYGPYGPYGGMGGMGGYAMPNMCNYQIPGFGAQQPMYPQIGWPYTYPYPFYSAYTPPSYSAFSNFVASEPPHFTYWPNYSPSSFMTAPGMVPGQFPFANSPADLSAQAAAAAEHNKQLAAMPTAPPYMVASNPADYAAQAALLGQAPGMMPGMVPPMGPAMVGAASTTIAPYKPGEPNSFWCREIDGAWSLRGYSEIALGEVSPGHWEKHAVSGYFFWVRHLPQ